MKKNHFYHCAFLFLMCQFATLFASAQTKKTTVVNKPLTPATTTAVATNKTAINAIAVPATNTIDATLQGVPTFQCISATMQVQDAGSTGRSTGLSDKNSGTISKNPDGTDPQLFQFETHATVIHECKIVFYKKSTNGQSSVSKIMLLTNAIITGKTQNPDKSISYKIVCEKFTITSE